MSEDVYVISDRPADSQTDLFHFERYVSPLYQLMVNSKTQTPFTIGIFGAWGSGKSTLINRLGEKIENNTAGLEFLRIDFNPWFYRGESNLIIPLLHTIQDTLDSDPEKRFIELGKKISTILTRLGTAFLIKTVTANQITLKDFQEQEKIYEEGQKRAKSIIRELRNQLQEVVNKVTDDGKKGYVVFFIDDLDRCEPDQIIGLMESLKLFLDLRHCYFVLALDEEVIHRGIALKYANFKFLEQRQEQIGREYLEKMIQLPLYLYPISSDEVEAYIRNLKPPADVRQQAELLSKSMLPNPRKIKRILNRLTIDLAILKGDRTLSDRIKPHVLARMVVIQVQNHELYRDILRYPELPKYLSMVFRDEVTLDPSHPTWLELGEQGQVIRELCKKYYRPRSWLEEVFKADDAFPTSANEMEPYFNMLGQVNRN